MTQRSRHHHGDWSRWAVLFLSTPDLKMASSLRLLRSLITSAYVYFCQRAWCSRVANYQIGSHRWTINRHQDSRSSSIDFPCTPHPNASSSRETSPRSTHWCSKEGMGEGWYRGKVARKCMGQEAQTKGTETDFDRFRAIQGYAIEEAGTF